MRTTAILNLKGGVAKTVTCVNMAAILAADYGKRVLVVDADSQANTTEFFGGSEAKTTLSSLLRGEYITPHTAIHPSNVEGVDLISADDSLMDLDLSAVKSKEADMTCLDRLLASYMDEYDFCLIDCPPAFNAASAAALLAATDVIIPIKLDAFSLRVLVQDPVRQGDQDAAGPLVRRCLALLQHGQHLHGAGPEMAPTAGGG